MKEIKSNTDEVSKYVDGIWENVCKVMEVCRNQRDFVNFRKYHTYFWDSLELLPKKCQNESLKGIRQLFDRWYDKQAKDFWEECERLYPQKKTKKTEYKEEQDFYEKWCTKYNSIMFKSNRETPTDLFKKNTDKMDEMLNELKENGYMDEYKRHCDYVMYWYYNTYNGTEPSENTPIAKTLYMKHSK